MKDPLVQAIGKTVLTSLTLIIIVSFLITNLKIFSLTPDEFGKGRDYQKNSITFTCWGFYRNHDCGLGEFAQQYIRFIFLGGLIGILEAYSPISLYFKYGAINYPAIINYFLISMIFFYYNRKVKRQ